MIRYQQNVEFRIKVGSKSRANLECEVAEVVVGRKENLRNSILSSVNLRNVDLIIPRLIGELLRKEKS